MYSIDSISKDHNWKYHVDILQKQLGYPNNPLLVTSHFLHSTFPKIGGEIYKISLHMELKAVAFLYPSVHQQKNGYILRLYKLSEISKNELQKIGEQILKMVNGSFVNIYNPNECKTYTSTSYDEFSYKVGNPNKEEAEKIRELQRKIWGSTEESLYPSDIHSDDFSLPTSLVLRNDGNVVGFLFGFYKFDLENTSDIATCPVSIESQLMGIDPMYQKRGLAKILKNKQFELALNQKIDKVHWTVDPLQLGNAILNYNKLGSIATKFYRNYYSFRNDLNVVTASRFEVTRFSGKNIEGAIQYTNSKNFFNLSSLSDEVDIFTLRDKKYKKPTAKYIAFEIPKNWTLLQEKQPKEAVKIREATDDFFEENISMNNYVISSVTMYREKYFLLGHKFNT